MYATPLRWEWWTQNFPNLIRTSLNQFHRAWADYGRGQGSARWPFLQIAAEHLNSGDDEAKHRRLRARALAVMVSSSDSPLGPAGLLLSHRANPFPWAP